MRIAKRLPIALAALMLLVVIFGCAPAIAMSEDPLQSQVSINFLERIYFADPETGGMNIDYKTQPLPLGDTYIPAPDGDHTLRVCDGRLKAGGWKVDAIMTRMQSGAQEFAGQLHLYNPESVEGLTFHLSGSVPNQYVLIYNISRLVMTAAPDRTQGNFDLGCKAEDTRFFINNSQTPSVKALPYEATITWTLTLDPPG